MVQASGMGSMPGTDVRQTVRAVRDLLGDHIPFLPETPDRGPGADMVGRVAGHLLGLGADLQPSGWRLTDHHGLDSRRAQSYLRQDLDELAEAFDGWVGPLKVQWCGPWTLAATVELPRGERVLTDDGATRDLVESSTAALLDHLHDVRRLLPGADLVVQWDEPALPAVLDGRLATASGYGRVRPVDPGRARDVLSDVVDEVRPLASRQLVHCCAPGAPVAMLRPISDLALALDTSLVKVRQWDGLADLVEHDRELWAGLVPTDGSLTRPDRVADRLRRVWHEVGLEPRRLHQVTVTPACGMAGASPAGARALLKACVGAAAELAESAESAGGGSSAG